jgi:hypothetical protein
MKNERDFLALLGNKSLAVETNKDAWQNWVLEPIITFPLAPRYAKATLLIVGDLLAQGVGIIKIISTLNEINYCFKKGEGGYK